MVDISNLDDSGKGRSFPPFDKSRLADAVADASILDDAMKEALGASKLREAMSGLSTVGRAVKEALGSTELQEAMTGRSIADKAIKEALGGSTLASLGEGIALGRDHYRTIAEQLGDITGHFGEGISARIAEFDAATRALREARFDAGIDAETLDRLGKQPDLGEYLHGSKLPEPYIPTFPDLPPNPIFETNALLEKLSSDFEDMKAVTAATVDVQEKQAALVAQLLAASLEGSAAQEKAAKETLRVAKISMWISLVAVLLTVAGIGAQALLR